MKSVGSGYVGVTDGGTAVGDTWARILVASGRGVLIRDAGEYGAGAGDTSGP